jgi:predicted TIM-barrel fold metal-dependent hydrolase
MMHHTVCHPMEMMLAVVSFLGGGVLERFPKLQVGFLEANCSWLPWLLWRLDEHFEYVGRYERPDLKLEPSEYFKRQCYVSVEADEQPVKFVEQAGLAGSVVFSTDYPHSDSKYPRAVDSFLETASVSEDTKRKILWDNTARMYGF